MFGNKHTRLVYIIYLDYPKATIIVYIFFDNFDKFHKKQDKIFGFSPGHVPKNNNIFLFINLTLSLLSASFLGKINEPFRLENT